MNEVRDGRVPAIHWWRTSLGSAEIEGLTHAVSSRQISQGPLTVEFEAAIAAALQVPFAVATTSGSAALLMALLALDVGRDDEVIVPNRTFVATAHAALLIGAKVVLVDTLPDRPTMDVRQVERCITPRTRAIVPVHLNGRAVDIEGIRALARERGIRVVEDAAQALFSKTTRGYLGTEGDAGCFSLGMTKLISTGQGGVVVTRSAEVYAKLKLIRNHGVTDGLSDEYPRMGFNFKFTDLLASVGLAQLARAADRITHVRRIYARYAEGLDKLAYLRLIPVSVSDGEVPLWVEALCPERGTLMEYLNTHGVETRRFLPDLHMSPHLGVQGPFPNSRLFAEQGLFLPCGPDQPLDNVDRVIELLCSYQRDRQS